MLNPKTPLLPTTLRKLVAHAHQVVKACPMHCRDFVIKRSPLHPDRLFLRWTRINACNLDRIVSTYQWETFTLHGELLTEGLPTTSPEQAHQFFTSLEAVPSEGFPNPTRVCQPTN